MSASSPLARLTLSDSANALVAGRRCGITVCVPTVDEEATIGEVCRELVGLRRLGAIDRVLVVDDSTDDTPWIAEAAGAEVIRQRDLQPQAGPVVGKGDAMWRALSVVDDEVVAFVDGDTIGFEAHMAGDLVAAVALDGYDFVKATYRRPFALGDVRLPTGGGRVTELTAKPLLATLFPALAAFEQPLAGEIAGRTDVLRRVPFATGYSVDIALLIDTWRQVGIERMAQVDTGVRQNRHRPLHELAAMATEVSAGVFDRAGIATPGASLLQRPALVRRWAIGSMASRSPAKRRVPGTLVKDVA